MLSCLILAQVRTGGGFGVGEAFSIQGPVSEIEQLFHGLGQRSS